MPNQNKKESWKEKLRLAIAQASPFTLTSQYKDADFEILFKCVESLLHQEREKAVEEIRKEIENLIVNRYDTPITETAISFFEKQKIAEVTSIILNLPSLHHTNKTNLEKTLEQLKNGLSAEDKTKV